MQQSPSQHLVGLLLVAGLLSGIFSNAWAEEKGASVSLRAKWRGSPYLHEAAEFVAEDDRDKIWQFLEASFLQEQPSDVSMCWAHVLDLTSSLLDKSVNKVVPLSLASRKYSAKLAMYQQILEETHPNVQSCCIVDVMGHVATSIEDLPAAIQKASSVKREEEDYLQLFPFDHVYRGKVDRTGASHAILYAPVGAACAKQLHFALKVAANAGHIVYAYRPVLHASCEISEGSCTQLGAQEPLLLPGWGVEAVLKNTEYSAMDDKDKKAEAAAKGKATGKASSKEQSLGEHEGFVFDTLVKRKPALAQELLTFRDHLMSMDEDDNVKVWDLKDVGLQATQRIMQAADPLSLLTELSQNFPSLVSSLSRQEVNASLRQAVTHNQQYLSPGRNFMLLNGLVVDINDLDYFGFLDRLKSELQLMELLSNLGLDHEDMKHLMQLRVDDTSDAMEDARLELGLIGSAKHKDKVFFVNNVGSDEQYQGMSKRISDVLNTYPNRLRPLGLNAYSMLVVVDPVSADGLIWAETILKTWQEGVTVNLGMTLKVPDVLARVRSKRTDPLAGEPKAPEWKYKSASERFALAFLTIETAFTEYHAMLFWVQLSSKVLRSGSWGEDMDETFRAVFEKYWQMASAEAPRHQIAWQARNTQSNDAWAQLKEGTGWSETAAARLLAIAEWMDNKGIADFDGPVGFLNGMQCSFTSGSDAQTFQQELLYKVLMEQQRLQEAVYYARIEDGDNVQEKLMELSGTLMRWNPAIIAADKRKYVLLNSLVQDKEFSKLVPRLVRPQVEAFKGDDQNLELHPATHVVVCNIGSKYGRQLAAEALRFLTGDLPGSHSGRVLLVFNPAHQEAALPNAAPTLLEILVHLALAQLPQFSGQSEIAVSTLSVAEFLSELLGDEALALRFAGPIDANAATEVEVALQYAKSSGINADMIKKGVLKLLDVMPDTSGVIRYRPTPEMVAMRVAHARMARSALNLEMGASSLISNGRVVATHSPTDTAAGAVQDIVAEDIDLVTAIATKYQANQAMASQVDEAYRQGRVKKVPALDQKHADSIAAKLDDLVAAASAAISLLGKVEGRQVSKQLTQVLAYMKGRTVEVQPPEGVEPSGLHIVCIINPLTRPAQRISQVLSMLRGSLLAPTISLILNPELDLSDLPLKSFYRYALPDLAPGDQVLSVLPGPPAAYFSRLPRKRVLTLNMDVPEAWLVEAVQSQHDLDNLRLVDVAEPVAYAELELSALMLTGSCIDVTAGGNRGTPPRGLQLHLGTPSSPHVVDTLVMSNLAYFQLKAAPGRWLLSLAPGRTRDLYQLVSSTPLAGQNVPITVKAMDANEEKARNELSTIIMMHSLSGKHMILRVRKRPGMEREDVLKAAGEESSDEDIWGGSYYGQDDDDDEDDEDDAGPSAKVQASKKPGGDVINVFTVASGHMYERLQKIMMLSVINNTKSRVKFWFISNYMSPHHKQVIPAMAEKFGFDWEFVTYKWPHWLHKQTDKQRIIWAYKILFLDVLFPLGVERIIFVDSDQVVRANLAELYHMDIKGKPYAYTPFCDNNKEMDEFRFWKGGFWKSHLQGKPYHISALYLVDLKQFRAIAAGDKLRVVYDQLSKDPNSLANLDQDLPNYAQHQIPIHSLPKEWLWCESWCGNSTKKKAKTIDLCNNPKTKEPKLSAARRIIAEWPELDRMQAEFTQQFDAELGFDHLSSAQEAVSVEAANLADLMAETSTEPEANSVKDEL